MSEQNSWRFSFTLPDEQIDYPELRKPTILVCGATGAGKSTTINTLFGAEVSEVGHFARGTTKDEIYEWESRGKNIDVVDLPGLGDSGSRDRDYRDMYRRRVEQAHAFIVVTTPPRPAALPTLRTVKLLLECGVPASQLVIAYNRLSLLNYGPSDDLTAVVIDGLGGPAFEDELAAVEQGREALLRDLKAGTGRSTFELDQIVPYDALTGWNLFGVLDRVAVSLPGDTVVPWENAVSVAAEQARERQRRRSARDQIRIQELQQQIDAQKAKSEASDAEKEELARRIKSLERRRKRAKKNDDAIDAVAKQEIRHKKRLADRAANWIEEKGYPDLADATRALARFLGLSDSK